MGIRNTGVIVALSLALLLPATAFAEEATKSAEATPTKAPAPNAKTREYNLDFTLPTAGKSGCQVCHADPNLVKPSGETTQSIYVDPAKMAETAHAETVCTGCHMDFAYKTPHENVEDGEDWVYVAQTACKNCHTQQYSDVSLGAHTSADKPGVDASETAAARLAEGKPATVPTCGMCHGSHEIGYIDVAKYEASGTVESVREASKNRAELHQRGLEVCGQCHEDYTNSYEDYYHGAAYREGAPDAPACWDCHGAHEVLPASDRRSPVNEANLAETCGKEGCHAGEVDEEFLEYSKMIHGRDEQVEANLLYSWVDTARSAVQGFVDTVSSWF